MTIRALVLSGGGGRGAFHAGVYKYLAEADKPNIGDDYHAPWTPDVIVGTSIGAVNGAAITQGISAEDLETFWLGLREHHVQGLPPGMRWLTRFVMNRFLRQSIGVRLPQVQPPAATSPPARDAWPPLPLLPRPFSNWLLGRWNNLIDTGPLLHTLRHRLGLDEDKIAASQRLLLIEATNIRTGEQVAFCNRAAGLPDDPTIKPGITLKRILASCSIPLVYPWTVDDDGEAYWDGAVVANTPLHDAIHAVRNRPLEEPMEAVVVLMTPWWEAGERPPLRRQGLPNNFGEALTWTLDWALLASFRVSLELARTHNERAKREIENGVTPRQYRQVKVVIVAPQDFLPVTRIIDYDEPASRQLIAMGYEAARTAWQANFSAK